MELSERIIQTLEAEGYEVYEWQDKPGTNYPEHVNDTDVTFLVTDGSMVFNFSGEMKELSTRERLDIKAGIPYSIVVGPSGVIYIRGDK